MKYDAALQEILKVTDGQTALKVMEVLQKNKLVKCQPKKEISWLFNFKDGGFNSVWAKNKEQAISRVKEKFGNSDKLVPNYESIRPFTESDYKSQASMFN